MPRRSRSPNGRRHQGQAKEREAWEASLHNRRSERSLQTKEVARVQGRGSTSVFAPASGGSARLCGESHASSVANLEDEALYQQQQQQQQFDIQFSDSVEDFEQRRRSGGAGVVTAASTTSNKDDGGSRVTDNRAVAGGGVNVDRSRAVVCKSVPDVGEPAPELFGDGDTVMDTVTSESDRGLEPGSDTGSAFSVCDSFEFDSTVSDVDNPSRDVFGQAFEIDGENADGLGNADCHNRGEGTTLGVDRKRRGAISAAAAGAEAEKIIQVTKRRRRVPAVSVRRRISKKRRQTPEDTCPQDRRCVRFARLLLGLPVKKAAIPAKPLGKAVPNRAASEHIAMTQNMLRFS